MSYKEKKEESTVAAFVLVQWLSLRRARAQWRWVACGAWRDPSFVRETWSCKNEMPPAALRPGGGSAPRAAARGVFAALGSGKRENRVKTPRSASLARSFASASSPTIEIRTRVSRAKEIIISQIKMRCRAEQALKFFNKKNANEEV